METLRYVHGTLPICTGQNGAKLFSTITRHKVTWPLNTSVQGSGDTHQTLVPGTVPVVVIELFE